MGIQQALLGVVPPAPPPAAGVIQRTTGPLSLGDPSTGLQTFSNAFPSALTPGNTVVVMTNTYYSGTPLAGVTIGGATATRIVNFDAPGRSTVIEIWVATVGSSPNRDIVINVPTAGMYPTVAGLECSPLVSSPIDTGTQAYAEGTGDNPTTTLAATTSQANTLVLAQWNPLFGDGNLGSGADPAEAGWEPWSYQSDSNTYQGGSMAYRVLTATGAPTATWSKTAPGDWFGYSIALKFA